MEMTGLFPRRRMCSHAARYRKSLGCARIQQVSAAVDALVRIDNSCEQWQGSMMQDGCADAVDYFSQ